jgi:hypothetical protein
MQVSNTLGERAFQRRFRPLVMAMWCVVATTTWSAAGQQTAAGIVGQVTDESGAV